MPRTIKQEIFSSLSTLAAAFPEAVKDGEVDWKALEAIFKDVPSAGAEKYELAWAGKAEAKREAGRDAVGRTLRYYEKESKNPETTQNLYIEGDNLEVLKLLRENYYGTVKMIYIDPPYNTGNDFIYRDNFTQEKTESELAEGNVDEEGQRLIKNYRSSNRYHAIWLSMLYPRLKLARDFLSMDGMIFISIDDNEVHHLRNLCDEIFGEDNFIATYVWKSRAGKDHTAIHASVSQEYILCYSRNKYQIDVGKDIRERSGGNYSDERGGYRRELLRQWGTNDRKEDRPTMYYPVLAPDGTSVYPVRSDGSPGR